MQYNEIFMPLVVAMKPTFSGNWLLLLNYWKPVQTSCNIEKKAQSFLQIQHSSSYNYDIAKHQNSSDNSEYPADCQAPVKKKLHATVGKDKVVLVVCVYQV